MHNNAPDTPQASQYNGKIIYIAFKPLNNIDKMYHYYVLLSRWLTDKIYAHVNVLAYEKYLK